jgi:nicotinamide mononucleotide transporter
MDLELPATVLGLTYVVLSIKKIRWCWLFAAGSAAIYVYIFWQTKLYNLAFLQIFFICSSLYGLYQWSHKAPDNFMFLNWSQRVLIIFITLLLSYLNYCAWLYLAPNAANVLDSFLSISSIVASLLATRRKIDSWYFWALINTISVYLFIISDLYPTATLYFIFLALSFWGLKSWTSGKLDSDTNPHIPEQSAAKNI